MSIELAEKLKRELTDKWVVVAEEVPELRRFSSLTGKVKTVNMNCRALVEFDGPEDIGWYDIDPQFLTVVDSPRPRVSTEEKSKPEAKAAPAKSAKPAVGGSNPLDAIRAGGASKKAAPAGGSPLDAIRAGSSKPAAAKPAGGSPLDAIRAANKPEAAPSADAAKAEEAPAQETPKPKPAASGSPLDQIRASGGFKG